MIRIRTNGVMERTSAGNNVRTVSKTMMVQEAESPCMVIPGTCRETPCGSAAARKGGTTTPPRSKALLLIRRDRTWQKLFISDSARDSHPSQGPGIAAGICAEEYLRQEISYSLIHPIRSA